MWYVRVANLQLSSCRAADLSVDIISDSQSTKLKIGIYSDIVFFWDSANIPRGFSNLKQPKPRVHAAAL